MKSGRISALAAAGVMAAGALAALTGAGTASAASYTHLCINNAPSSDECIYASGPRGAELAALGNSGLTNWTYPTTNGGTGAIRQANTDLCLQVDASEVDGNTGYPVVRGASCVGDTAEEWQNVYDGETDRTMFRSVWADDRAPHFQYCLEGDEANGDLTLYLCTSSFNDQSWGTS